jgi:hypothetical protein
MQAIAHSSRLTTTALVMVCVTLLFLSAFVGCNTGEWMEVRCPDEHYATRLPRDPSSTYRHYGSMYESGYRASEGALNSLIARLSPADTLKLIATDFNRYLAGERSAVQTQLQKAVSLLQENPCDNDARKRFQYLIEYINFNGNYLHKIPAACMDTSSNLRMMLEEYRREKN